MLLFGKRHSKKAGLPPGSLVHVGEERTGKVRISRYDYDAERSDRHEFETIADCLKSLPESGNTWINIDGLHDADVIAQIGAAFSLHDLVLEDILDTTLRPKIEENGDHIFIVSKMLRLRGETFAF